MRTSRIAIGGLALIALLLALCLAACTTSHPVDARLNAELSAPAVKLDTSKARIPRSATTPPHLSGVTPDIVTGSSPGILSGIGNVFSTPEGRARRQAVKLAKAAVPRSIGKGAVYAPLATEVINAYKPRATVAVASDSATLQVATNAVAGHDNTATQTATTQEAPSVGATIAKAITGPLGYVLAIAAAGAIGYLLYLICAFIPKRKDADSA
jgi:hypothetical protein